MTGSASSADGAPRTRQRIHKTPPPLDVPDIDEDAGERKRVLNVLAQRRYREKKRQARLKDKGPKSATVGLDTGNISTQSSGIQPEQDTELASTQCANVDTLVQPTLDVFSDVEEIIRASGDLDRWDPSLTDSMPSLFTSTEPPPVFGAAGDTSWLTPSTSDGTISSSFLDSLASISPPSSNTNTTSSSYNSPPADEFADTYLLPVHELMLLKALMRIAGRIGCDQNLWSLETLSSFYLNTAPPHDSLPEVWRPTAAQIMVPHHPFIDFLPWPSVRDRLLAIMALPSDARPPSAAGDMWLMNFAYDVEDNSEGIRIYGGDPYDPESWEVGQKLFESWWFVFDRKVVERSNKWRELRGAPLLTAKSTTSEP